MISTNIRQGLAGAVQGGIGAAIQQAALRTGVDFGYLLGQARIESGFNPDARAKTSSATGLFQFIEQTWLGTVQKHGDKHGLGWAADAIKRSPSGRYHVADPATRRAILDLRKDPESASSMAAEFAADNQAFLESRLGRPAGSVDLYLAHFLGPGGAAKFLSAHDANPDAPAAAILPAAARANRWVFYDRNGSPRSFAEIRERFAAKLGDDAAPIPSPAHRDFPETRMALAETGADIPIARPSPQYARLAYLMLAELGG